MSLHLSGHLPSRYLLRESLSQLAHLLLTELAISVPPASLRMICHRCGISVDPDSKEQTKRCGGLQKWFSNPANESIIGKGKASHAVGKWKLSRPTPDMLREAEKLCQRAKMAFDLAFLPNSASGVDKLQQDKIKKEAILFSAQAQLAELKFQNTVPRRQYGCYYCYAVEEHMSCCNCARALGCYNEPPCLHCETRTPKAEKENPSIFLPVEHSPLQV